MAAIPSKRARVDVALLVSIGRSHVPVLTIQARAAPPLHDDYGLRAPCAHPRALIPRAGRPLLRHREDHPWHPSAERSRRLALPAYDATAHHEPRYHGTSGGRRCRPARRCSAPARGAARLRGAREREVRAMRRARLLTRAPPNFQMVESKRHARFEFEARGGRSHDALWRRSGEPGRARVCVCVCVPSPRAAMRRARARVHGAASDARARTRETESAASEARGARARQRERGRVARAPPVVEPAGRHGRRGRRGGSRTMDPTCLIAAEGAQRLHGARRAGRSSRRRDAEHNAITTHHKDVWRSAARAGVMLALLRVARRRLVPGAAWSSPDDGVTRRQ